MDQGLDHRFTLIVGNNGMGKSILLDVQSVTFGSFLPGVPVGSCDALNVAVETLKPAEDAEGFVLSLYEAERIRWSARLDFGVAIDRVYNCDLLENSTGEIDVTGNRITIDLRPFEIRTSRCVPCRD